jgi:hypothetical protein
MRAFLTFVLLLSLVAVFPASAAKAEATITIVVVHADAGLAKDAERVVVPAGTTVSMLMDHDRHYGLKEPISWVQGMIELKRLPASGKKEENLRWRQSEARRADKANVELRDGDIVISDVWPDL